LNLRVSPNIEMLQGTLEDATAEPATPVAPDATARPVLLDASAKPPWGVIDKFEEAFGKGTLNPLPDHPRFAFCGTGMALGATRGPKDR
jgi:hypothetical protein